MREIRNKCAALNCFNKNSKTNGGVAKSYHRFPKDEPRRSIWIQNAGVKDGDVTRKRLCSDHFLPHLIDKHEGTLPRLRAQAVPTIFSWTRPAEEGGFLSSGESTVNSVIFVKMEPAEHDENQSVDMPEQKVARIFPVLSEAERELAELKKKHSEMEEEYKKKYSEMEEELTAMKSEMVYLRGKLVTAEHSYSQANGRQPNREKEEHAAAMETMRKKIKSERGRSNRLSSKVDQLQERIHELEENQKLCPYCSI